MLIPNKLKKQLKQLEKELSILNLNKDDVCIVGSFVLALYNIRENRDLDIVINPQQKKKISKKKKAFHLTNIIEVVGDNWANTINISDISLVNNPDFYNSIDGFRIVKPEILFLVMLFRGREKNIRDIELLENYALYTKTWNWDLIKSIIPKSKTHDFKIKKNIKNNKNCILQLPRSYNTSLKNQLILKLPTSALIHSQFKNQKFCHYDLFVYYDLIKSKNFSNTNPTNKILDFIPSDFLNLVQNFKKNGFLNRHPVMISPNGLILDGIKRLACAIFFDIKEIPVIVQKNRESFYFDETWLNQNFNKNFSSKLMLIKNNIFKKYGLWSWIMVWPPAQPWFNDIDNELLKFGKIQWKKTFNLKKSLPNFIRKAYSVDDIQKWKIELKISAIKNYEPLIHIVALEIPSDSFRIKNDIYAYQSNTSVLIKKLIRKKYGKKIPDYFYDIIIHIGDNHEHNSLINEFLQKDKYFLKK